MDWALIALGAIIGGIIGWSGIVRICQRFVSWFSFQDESKSLEQKQAKSDQEFAKKLRQQRCMKCDGYQDALNVVCSDCKRTMDAESNVTLQLRAFLYILLRDHLPAGVVERIMEDHVRKVGNKTYAFGPLVCLSFSNEPLGAYVNKLARELLNEPADSELSESSSPWTSNQAK